MNLLFHDERSNNKSLFGAAHPEDYTKNMPPMPTITLIIKVIEGNLVRNTEISGKMDPFI
jgi:hypothetical protein